jgi:hypothetical protein
MIKMEITYEMLHAAVKKAVELKIIPKNASLEDYLRYWNAIEQILRVALKEGGLT